MIEHLILKYNTDPFPSGDYLLIAVRKQKGRVEQEVIFPSVVEVAVQEPHLVADSYSLLTNMDGEEDEYPLLDSNGRVSTRRMDTK